MWAWPKGTPRGKQSPEHLAATRRKPKPKAPVSPVLAQCAAWLRQRRRVEFGLTAGLRYVPEATLLALAERLTLNEPVGDPNAPQVRADLVRMIFHRWRLDWTKGWRVERIIAAIPETWESRLVIAENFTTAEKLLGPVERQSFSVVRLIEVGIQLETAAAFETYVRDCLKQPNRRSKMVSAIISQGAFDYRQSTKEEVMRTVGKNEKKADVGTRSEHCGYMTPEEHEAYIAEAVATIKTIPASFSPIAEEEKEHAEETRTYQIERADQEPKEEMRASNLTPEQALQEWKDRKEKEWLAEIGTGR